MRRRTFCIGSLLLPRLAHATELLPIFDAHLHYSHDAWEVIPPRKAVALLREAGLKRAMVSSSNDDGNQMLLAESPDLIVPEIRPYRRRSDLGTWMKDPGVLAYVEERLSRFRYAAIGEFHLYGADAELPIPRRIVALAKQHGLILHAHSDTDCIDRLFGLDADARILWAHSGFDRPEVIAPMLRKHRNLWCDLAFRTEHGSGGKVDAAWRTLFSEFPDRFMVGTDSFTPERWPFVVEHANWSRAWLSSLSAELAEKIAWRNGEALVASFTANRRL